MDKMETTLKILRERKIMYEVKSPHHIKIGVLNYYPGKESFNYDNEPKLGKGLQNFLDLVELKHSVYIQRVR